MVKLVTCIYVLLFYVVLLRKPTYCYRYNSKKSNEWYFSRQGYDTIREPMLSNDFISIKEYAEILTLDDFENGQKYFIYFTVYYNSKVQSF